MDTKRDKSILTAIVSFSLVAMLVVFLVSYAWFSLSESGELGVNVNVEDGLVLDVRLYWYQDNYKYEGAKNDNTLYNNIGDFETEGTYFKLPNVGQYQIGKLDEILGNTKIGPGDTLSFALMITNLNASQAIVDISTYNIKSYLMDENSEKQEVSGNSAIQNAYQLKTTKVTYQESDLSETEITSVLPNSYLSNNSAPIYRGLALTSKNNNESIAIIYFDLFFDPEIRSHDGELELPNSNGFANQILGLKEIGILKVY